MGIQIVYRVSFSTVRYLLRESIYAIYLALICGKSFIVDATKRVRLYPFYICCAFLIRYLIDYGNSTVIGFYHIKSSPSLKFRPGKSLITHLSYTHTLTNPPPNSPQNPLVGGATQKAVLNDEDDFDYFGYAAEL